MVLCRQRGESEGKDIKIILEKAANSSMVGDFHFLKSGQEKKNAEKCILPFSKALH
jgi:hypothetical protein